MLIHPLATHRSLLAKPATIRFSGEQDSVHGEEKSLPEGWKERKDGTLLVKKDYDGDIRWNGDVTVKPGVVVDGAVESTRGDVNLKERTKVKSAQAYGDLTLGRGCQVTSIANAQYGNALLKSNVSIG